MQATTTKKALFSQQQDAKFVKIRTPLEESYLVLCQTGACRFHLWWQHQLAEEKHTQRSAEMSRNIVPFHKLCKNLHKHYNNVHEQINDYWINRNMPSFRSAGIFNNRNLAMSLHFASRENRVSFTWRTGRMYLSENFCSQSFLSILDASCGYQKWTVNKDNTTQYCTSCPWTLG